MVGESIENTDFLRGIAILLSALMFVGGCVFVYIWAGVHAVKTHRWTWLVLALVVPVVGSVVYLAMHHERLPGSWWNFQLRHRDTS